MRDPEKSFDRKKDKGKLEVIPEEIGAYHETRGKKIFGDADYSIVFLWRDKHTKGHREWDVMADIWLYTMDWDSGPLKNIKVFRDGFEYTPDITKNEGCSAEDADLILATEAILRRKCSNHAAYIDVGRKKWYETVLERKDDLLVEQLNKIMIKEDFYL